MKISALTDEQAAALGRIAAGSALLDGLVETIIGALVCPDTPGESQERARIAVRGQSTSTLTGILKRLAPFGGNSADSINEWARATRAIAEERNKVLHAIWVINLSDGATVSLRRPRSGAQVVAVTIDDLRDILQRQDVLQGQGLAIAEQLGAE